MGQQEILATRHQGCSKTLYKNSEPCFNVIVVLMLHYIRDVILGQGDLAIFVMGGSGRVEIMVKINYSDTAGQYKEGKSGESVKYGSE